MQARTWRCTSRHNPDFVPLHTEASQRAVQLETLPNVHTVFNVKVLGRVVPPDQRGPAAAVGRIMVGQGLHKALVLSFPLVVPAKQNGRQGALSANRGAKCPTTQAACIAFGARKAAGCHSPQPDVKLHDIAAPQPKHAVHALQRAQHVRPLVDAQVAHLERRGRAGRVSGDGWVSSGIWHTKLLPLTSRQVEHPAAAAAAAAALACTSIQCPPIALVPSPCRRPAVACRWGAPHRSSRPSRPGSAAESAAGGGRGRGGAQAANWTAGRGRRADNTWQQRYWGAFLPLKQAHASACQEGAAVTAQTSSSQVHFRAPARRLGRNRTAAPLAATLAPHGTFQALQTAPGNRPAGGGSAAGQYRGGGQSGGGGAVREVGRHSRRGGWQRWLGCRRRAGVGCQQRPLK